MFYVSVRKSLSSNHDISDKLVVFEGPEKRFGPDSDALINRCFDDLQRATSGKKVLCLVHGYANPIESVSNSYGIIHRKVTALKQYDLIIGFTWPSVKFVLQWWKSKRNSEKVDQCFVRMCRRLNTAQLDVMTHSLGARVVLSGLDEVPVEKPTFDNVFLTAAAIDNESLEEDEEFFQATSQCKRIFVMHTRKDGVLRSAYLAANADRALGLHGPESFAAVRDNVHVINCKKVVDSHSGYRKSDEVYAYIDKVLSNSDLPRWEQL